MAQMISLEIRKLQQREKRNLSSPENSSREKTGTFSFFKLILFVKLINYFTKIIEIINELTI